MKEVNGLRKNWGDVHITRGVRSLQDAKTNIFTIVVNDKSRMNDAKRYADEVKLALHNILNGVNETSAEEWATSHAKSILKTAGQ